MAWADPETHPQENPLARSGQNGDGERGPEAEGEGRGRTVRAGLKAGGRGGGRRGREGRREVGKGELEWSPGEAGGTLKHGGWKGGGGK